MIQAPTTRDMELDAEANSKWDVREPHSTMYLLQGWIRRAVAAEKFKAFVHSYLTQHGVPEGDPENPHQKEGCRIGARLDLLFAERDRLRAAK